MDIRDITVDAVVLKARDYKEQDKLLTYFALETGKGVAIARGAAKPSGKLRSIAQPFCRVSLTLSPPKGGVAFVSQGLQQNSFIGVGADLSALAYASYISELTDLAVPEHRPSPDFFALLLTVFSLLQMDDDHARTARYFELRLLQELGLLPDLTGCSCCGRSLMGGSFHLSPRAGGLLCAACGAGEAAPLICAGAVQTMRRLLEAPLVRLPAVRISRTMMEEIEQALAYYLDYHLEYSAKARRILQQLLD